MTKLRSLPILLTGLLIGILLSASINAAFVHADSTSNVINACVKTGGQIRILSTNQSCASNEIPLQWNVQGPPGPAGPPGTSGNSGLGYTCNNCQLIPFANKFIGNDFSNSQIVGSTFFGADIHGVIFKGSYLNGTDFSNANLTGADMSNLIDTFPQGGQFSNQVLGVRLVFVSANLINVNFQNDIFLNTDFSSANLIGANFANASFPIPYSIAGGSGFQQANLQGVNFTNVSFQKTNFSGATNMATANLTGTTWSNVTCPDGTNSDNDGSTCVGHF